MVVPIVMIGPAGLLYSYSLNKGVDRFGLILSSNTDLIVDCVTYKWTTFAGTDIGDMNEHVASAIGGLDEAKSAVILPLHQFAVVTIEFQDYLLFIPVLRLALQIG